MMSLMSFLSITIQAQLKQKLRQHEEGTYHQANQIVDKRGLFARDVMADKLKHPADEKRAPALMGGRLSFLGKLKPQFTLRKTLSA